MKIPVWNSLSARRRRWVGWLLGLFLGYTIFGFLILPLIVRAVAVNKLHAQLDREVSIAKVKINPFALSVTVHGLLIKDKDSQPFASWGEVHVNFQLASFFGKPWVFKEVSTTKPYFRVQMNKDYTLNFSDLLTKSATTNAPAAPGKPLALRIERLHIGGATASYTDLTPRTTFARVLGPLDVTLTNFRTDPDNKNPYSFSGTTDAGEKFAWSGYFFLDPLRSQGEFSLENIALSKYSPLYEDFIRFVVKDGMVDVSSAYKFQLSASNRVASVTNASFVLRSLKVAEPGSGTNTIELSEFGVRGASVDAVAHTAEVGSITGDGAHLWLRRDANDAVNVVELSQPVAGSNAPGGVLLLLRSVTNAVALLLDSTNAWTGVIHSVNLTNGAVTLEDLVNSRPMLVHMDQMTLTATNISNVPGTNLTAALSLRWNTNGTAAANVSASFLPPTVDAQLTFDKLELKPLDPYLEPQVDLFILDSKLSVNGQIQMRTPSNGLPNVTFHGDARLDDFATVDGVLAEDLLKWKSVRLEGIEANLEPPAVNIREIGVEDVYARVIVETNRTINLLAALRIADTNAPAVAAPKPTKAKRGKPSPAAAATTVTNAPPSALPKISIASMVFTNGQMRLTDRSLSPVVNLALQQFGGTVGGISSVATTPATVNLHAKVDNVGPVEISGTISPLASELAADLKVAVRDVDLTPTSPYSGKYAGYRIAKGKLGMDLNYKIGGRKLEAKNLITLDQFTFGEKVESLDATKLPVKLAVAVLKDRSGKIELDVPIDGNLDDPQFHLGKVINRAIVNVLTKIITSPFAMMGALFGGRGEELSFVEFAPGSVALSDAARGKLDALAKGLYERPALQLEIQGSVNPDADRAGLRRARLDQQLRVKKWMALPQSQRSTLKPEQIGLSAEEHATWLQTVYRLALAKGEVKLIQVTAETNDVAAPAIQPSAPAKPVVGKGASELLPPRKSAAAAAPTAGATPGMSERAAQTPAEMEQVLLAAIEITDAELQTLAADRAKSVRDYILQTGKAEAERIFLSENSTSGTTAKDSRVLLQLK